MADAGLSSDNAERPAGDFASWLADTQRALRGERTADVPCAGCTACCRSSQFVLVEPDEHDTLDHIPHELLFPAPRRPQGYMVLGYDERGHCPMLVDDTCSIYEHRPRACRTYDCRVFAAADVELDDDTKRDVAHRVARWQFRVTTDADRIRRDAVRAAATCLRRTWPELSEREAAPSPTELAVLAVELHELFLGGEPDVATLRVEVRRRIRRGREPSHVERPGA